MTRNRSALHGAPALHGVGTSPLSLRRLSPLPVQWLVGLFTGLLFGGAAFANPIGPDVVHGSARLTHPGPGALHVTTSPDTVINWRGFSIDRDEVTRFIQPSASSAVLNRVTGADPSAILGRLLSNGRVFLVNPHGIVFGEGSVVDTAGLVASTLDIGDADFRAGRYRFDAGPEAGAIVNRGLIKAGADGVFLLAPSVESSGVVRTAGGDLVLAAGRRITLTSLDLDGVRVEVQAPEDEALNLGALIAERGAAGVFAGTLRNAGTVEASAVEVGEDGVVRLVAQGDVTLEAGGRVAAEGRSGGTVHVESEGGTTWVSGEVSARGSEGRGGAIRLLGERVGLAGARVDASGAAGGGEVLVGGDVSGEGPVPRAEATYVSADSTVSADALGAGDGGKVVVFAEGFANVQGRLSARGGPHGGDGGFVETSGLGSFAIGHTPDTTAPGGEGGHWLIDPNDIEIVGGGGNVNISINSVDPFVSADDNARLGIDLLVAALSGGQSVTVRTTESGANSEEGDITLSTPFDVESTTGTNTLTLDAHRDIEINQAITDTADGAELNLVLESGEEVRFQADVTLRGGSLETRGSESTLVTNGAQVTLDGITWTVNTDGGLDIGVDGPGMVFAQNGADISAGGRSIHIGRNSQHLGDGTLTIESGAGVTAEAIFVGADEGSEGTVTVTGSGSTLTTTGTDNRIVVGDFGTGTLTIESGADVTAEVVIVGDFEGSEGTVTVTGSGSTLTTTGTDNEIRVGDEGTGTLEVLDGGLVETLKFDVGISGVGRAVIRGVAADGTRSRVMVSPAGGKFSGDFVDEGGFARVGRNAGSRGTLEILEGGQLQVRDGRDTTQGPLFHVARNKGSTGTLLIDGPGSSVEVIQDGPVDSSDPEFFSPHAWLGRRGGGTTTIRNGGRLRVQGKEAFVGISRDSVNSDSSSDPDTGPIDQQSVVAIQSGGAIEVDGEGANFVIGDSGPAADGVVTVSGSGSTLTTTGTDNEIRVGDEGTGTLEVLDGGLVETLIFDVGRSGVGRAVIRGVAADGTRSRVMVSPAGGKYSGIYADNGGFARVGRNAGSRGTLEILEGGLLQVRDGRDTHGPGLQVARNKGSTGTLLIDGSGSSLEVIQDGPAVFGNPRVSAGPYAQLGRRGGGSTTIRNGGRLLVQGEEAFVQISRDSVNPFYPDPDPGPIDQQSVVAIQSGGAIEVDGEGARFVIGDSGPAADGVVTVTGSGSTLTTTGTDNEIVVGDEGTGTLEVLDGGLVETLFFDVGRSGVGRAVIRGVAADGTRSRVMVSPAGGKFSGDFVDEGGFAQVGRNAGSRGTLEILEGGLLQVRDGRDTHGPGFTVARNKGSTGTLLIDGSGSSLEVIQDGPVDSSDPDFFGPYAQLGRRGGGTTTIRNGGRLLVQGEAAFVRVSRDSVSDCDGRPCSWADPDTGPIDQQSVVAIQSGGAIEVDGEGARFVIGDSGPAADGVVTVTGSGSTLTTTGTDNEIRVGDEGTGTLEVLDGGLVETLKFDVGISGVGRAVIRGVAADGTRSRVMVSPAGGKFSGDFVDEGGFARVGRNAGSRGTLEILEGGLLQVRDGRDTHGPGLQVARNKGSTGTLLIDGPESSLEVIQDSPAGLDNPRVSAGPYAQLGRRGGGTTTIRNGGRLLVQGEQAFVQISRDSVNPLFPDPDTGPIDQQSVVAIQSGGAIEVDGEGAHFVIGDSGPAADGVVTVSGSGSTLTTTGTDNGIWVGDEGTGMLEVLDGGLVDTLGFRVGRSGVGRAVIRGVAADGTRSRVMVSPAGGKFSGDLADEGGFAEVGRDAGSRGTLEILDGGLLRVLDGGGTFAPGVLVARFKGSVGSVLIDGADSSLEVVQTAPATEHPLIGPGPFVTLGRRGSGSTTIRNGGRLLVQGEEAFVGVSQDSVWPRIPDPDTGPIDQQSVVNIQSGGAIEVDGERAYFGIGNGGPAADGVVTVSGSGSTLTMTGTDNAITVGDEGISALTIGGGGSVRAERVIVGRRPGSQGTLRVARGGELDADTLLAVGKDFDFDTLTTQEPGGTGSVVEEVGSRVRYGALEVGAGGATNLELPLQVEEDVADNTDEILPAQPEGTAAPEIAEDTDPSADEEARARQEDEEGEQDEGDAEEEEAGEETVAGESGEDEREELPMCPA